jgi:hypothetical protein
MGDSYVQDHESRDRRRSHCYRDVHRAAGRSATSRARARRCDLHLEGSMRVKFGDSLRRAPAGSFVSYRGHVGAEPMRFFTASSSSTCFHPAPCSPSTPSGDTTTSSPHDRTLLRNRKTTRARTSLGLTADGFEPAPWFNDKRPLSANNNLRLFSRVLGAYRRSWHAGHPHTRRERSSS